MKNNISNSSVINYCVKNSMHHRQFMEPTVKRIKKTDKKKMLDRDIERPRERKNK